MSSPRGAYSTSFLLRLPGSAKRSQTAGEILLPAVHACSDIREMFGDFEQI